MVDNISMISKMGKKTFFIYPPDCLKGELLSYIYKKEFEVHLVDNKVHIEALLETFKDTILFINIDKDLDKNSWLEYIQKLQQDHKKVVIAVFSKNNDDYIRKSLLMDIGIKGGFIYLAEDNWKTVEVIIDVLEANEARGRRKSVRLDFDKNEVRENITVKIYTAKGYMVMGTIQSISSAGLLTRNDKGHIPDDDNVDYVIFHLEDREFYIKGYLLKKFDNGDFFVSFEDIREDDKEYIQSYIFRYLQKSFKQLLNIM